MSYELAADYYRNAGFYEFSELYAVKAHDAYAEWGALAKVNDLKGRYPQLLGSTDASTREEAQAPATGQATLDSFFGFHPWLYL